MFLDFSSPVFALAPLAGWSDLPLRECVKKFGADLTVSEMVSADALVFNRKRSQRLFAKSPLETPYSVQLSASKPAMLREAVCVLNDEEGIDIIDLNAGCPAPKVVRGGAGSALLKNPTLLGEMVETIKKASQKPLTSVKIRLGFEADHSVTLAKICEASGADFITVHGRTRAGGFTAAVDYEAIAAVKRSVKIPVIANGDIVSAECARAVLAQTNADGAMIGRGAMGAPWIFAELKNMPLENLRQQVILEHFDSMIRFYDDFGVPLFRKHLHRYSKGHSEAAAFRAHINGLDDAAAVRELITTFFGGAE